MVVLLIQKVQKPVYFKFCIRYVQGNRVPKCLDDDKGFFLKCKEYFVQYYDHETSCRYKLYPHDMSGSGPVITHYNRAMDN